MMCSPDLPRPVYLRTSQKRSLEQEVEENVGPIETNTIRTANACWQITSAMFWYIRGHRNLDFFMTIHRYKRWL